jgi:hypothetical protein
MDFLTFKHQRSLCVPTYVKTHVKDPPCTCPASRYIQAVISEFFPSRHCCWDQREADPKRTCINSWDYLLLDDVLISTSTMFQKIYVALGGPFPGVHGTMYAALPVLDAIEY